MKGRMLGFHAVILLATYHPRQNAPDHGFRELNLDLESIGGGVRFVERLRQGDEARDRVPANCQPSLHGFVRLYSGFTALPDQFRHHPLSASQSASRGIPMIESRLPD